MDKHVFDGRLEKFCLGEAVLYTDHLRAVEELQQSRREWEAGMRLKAESEVQRQGARARFDASQPERVKAILRDINAQGYVLVTETGHDVSAERATEVLTEAIATTTKQPGELPPNPWNYEPKDGDYVWVKPPQERLSPEISECYSDAGDVYLTNYPVSVACLKCQGYRFAFATVTPPPEA